ncbi:MAG: hypothetical protein LBP22_08820 [Deltaproteobacteria bacterium]|nr:hypothetical protein [Deltaproteobacteria bacterium]
MTDASVKMICNIIIASIILFYLFYKFFVKDLNIKVSLKREIQLTKLEKKMYQAQENGDEAEYQVIDKVYRTLLQTSYPEFYDLPSLGPPDGLADKPKEGKKNE